MAWRCIDMEKTPYKQACMPIRIRTTHTRRSVGDVERDVDIDLRDRVAELDDRHLIIVYV